MTVNEYIDARKKEITIDDIINDVNGLVEYSIDCYGHKLNEEYQGDYGCETLDPWLDDVVCLEKALELLNKMKGDNKIEN